MQRYEVVVFKNGKEFRRTRHNWDGTLFATSIAAIQWIEDARELSVNKGLAFDWRPYAA